MPRSLLIEAYRAEALMFRRDGKESAARKLEGLAKRLETLMKMYHKAA